MDDPKGGSGAINLKALAWGCLYAMGFTSLFAGAVMARLLFISKRGVPLWPMLSSKTPALIFLGVCVGGAIASWVGLRALKPTSTIFPFRGPPDDSNSETQP